MRLTANFTLSEFESQDGAPTPLEALQNLQQLANNLQVLRDHINKPININSGYRSPSHNKNVGGSKNSYHMKGMAADIVVNGMRPSEVGATLISLTIEGKITKGGLGIYSTFVHYDIRGTFKRFK